MSQEKRESTSENEYQKWIEEINSLPFIERATKMKDKIIESDELASEDRKFFQECFDYVKSLYQKNKPLDCNLLKIHMGLKGYDERQPQKMEHFIRTLMLLSLCGFSFEYAGKN